MRPLVGSSRRRREGFAVREMVISKILLSP
jgi:hypothetical protein